MQRFGWVLALVLCGSVLGVRAADLKETARATAAKSQKTVVTIRLVSKMKMNMMGQDRDEEQKVETTGTVIDPSGLTVADASSLDPTALIKSMLGNMGGNMKIDSEIKETVILLDDGTEVEANVVLTDADLGLAFIRPRDAARKFDAVTLKERSTPVQFLDDIFVLGRLGKLGNRAPSLALGRINAVVKGPRTFYVGGESMDMGCMAYSADGEPLGLCVMKHKAAAEGEGGGGMGLGMLANMGEMKNSVMPIIRPVNDIIEIAAQAKSAKAPAKPGATEK